MKALSLLKIIMKTERRKPVKLGPDEVEEEAIYGSARPGSVEPQLSEV